MDLLQQPPQQRVDGVARLAQAFNMSLFVVYNDLANGLVHWFRSRATRKWEPIAVQVARVTVQALARPVATRVTQPAIVCPDPGDKWDASNA